MPPLLGSSPSRPYKRCEVEVHFFLTSSYMACNYESKAMGKFLLPSQPDEGNFTSRTAYKTTLKAYWHDHMHAMEACEQWSVGRLQSGPGNVVTSRRRWRPVCPSNVASDVPQGVSLSVVFHLHADIWHRSHVCMQAKCFL